MIDDGSSHVLVLKGPMLHANSTHIVAFSMNTDGRHRTTDRAPNHFRLFYIPLHTLRGPSRTSLKLGSAFRGPADLVEKQRSVIKIYYPCLFFPLWSSGVCTRPRGASSRGFFSEVRKSRLRLDGFGRVTFPPLPVAGVNDRL